MRDDDFPTAPATAKVDPDEPSNVTPISEAPRRAKRPSPRATLERKLGDAADILGEMQADAIGILTPFAPVSAGTWAIYSDANTRAVLRLAASRPGLLKAILAGGDFASFMALGTFVAAMIVSVGVEMGRVEGDGLIAERLRVAEAFAVVMEEMEREGRSGTDEGTGDERPNIRLPGILGERAEASSP